MAQQCPHRGEEVRTETCPSCRGAVQVKVFACAKNGECTIAKSIPGVHVCDGCAPTPVPRAQKCQQVVNSELATLPRIETTSKPLAGVLVDDVSRGSTEVAVRLDDGQVIVAKNSRRIEKLSTRRCVVSREPTGWVLLQ